MAKKAETRKKKRAPPDLGPVQPGESAAQQSEAAATAPLPKRRKATKPKQSKADPEPSPEEGTSAAAAPAAEESEGGQLRAGGSGNDDFMPLDAAQAPVSLAHGGSGRKKRALVLPVGESSDQPTVIYVGHIPHGFYEDQMAGFFGQFGTIRRLRLSRNKTTSKSKHYAFIEFESPEVAAIVAECMNGYLLFGRILQVKLVPREKVHPMLWKGANRTFKKIPWQKIARDLHNRDRSLGEQKKAVTRLLRSDRRRRAKLEAAGISYEYLGVESILPAAPKHVKFE